ncbi:hypothetical protein ACIRF8_15405 [Streptomyces sp. NPDC102406]|uniref:hypothetical protein n=1 Tax=Streptomyces sp. NPDC102406 TaxID=3366171 RepID=UPI0038108314
MTTLATPEITVFPTGLTPEDPQHDRWTALAFDPDEEQLVASSGVKATPEEAEAALISLFAHAAQYEAA